MNKNDDKLLREYVRKVLHEETIEEGKFTDWVADRVGIPRDPSLSDMSPSGKYKDLLKRLNIPTLQNDFVTLRTAFLEAQGAGRTNKVVQDTIKLIRNYIITQMESAGINKSTAMFAAAEFIKSAEDMAHAQLHRGDRSADRVAAWRERLGLSEGLAGGAGGSWAAYILPDRTTAVLYNGGVLQDTLDSWRQRKGDAPFIKASGFYQTKILAGVIQLVHPSNPCESALEIAYIAGPGKPLTSLGYHMSPSGRLIMDRRPGKVSGDAQRSWVGAFGKMKSYPLDDISLPPERRRTPDNPGDDCDFQDLPDPLNYAYEGDPSIGRAAESAHNQIMSQLSQEEQDSLLAGLEAGAESFWDTTYKG